MNKDNTRYIVKRSLWAVGFAITLVFATFALGGILFALTIIPSPWGNILIAVLGFVVLICLGWNISETTIKKEDSNG